MAALRQVQKRNGSKQINLPAEICDALDFQVGEYLMFLLDGEGGVNLFKVNLEKRPDLREYLPGGLPKVQYGK